MSPATRAAADPELVRAQDPRTPMGHLMVLAGTRPDLRPVIATNSGCSSDLRAWIARLEVADDIRASARPGTPGGGSPAGADSLAPFGWTPSESWLDDSPFGSVLGDPLGDPLMGSPLFDVSVLDAVPGRPDSPVPEPAEADAAEADAAPRQAASRAPVRTAAARTGPARTGAPTASPTSRPTTRPSATVPTAAPTAAPTAWRPGPGAAGGGSGPGPARPGGSPAWRGSYEAPPQGLGYGVPPGQGTAPGSGRRPSRQVAAVPRSPQPYRPQAGPGRAAARPPVPGQNPPVPGQNPPVPGQNPPVPGQNPPIPGQNPQVYRPAGPARTGPSAPSARSARSVGIALFWFLFLLVAALIRSAG